MSHILASEIKKSSRSCSELHIYFFPSVSSSLPVLISTARPAAKVSTSAIMVAIERATIVSREHDRIRRIAVIAEIIGVRNKYLVDDII